MRTFATLGLLSALCTTVQADPEDWVGVWEDPIYGGFFQICVSEVGGTYYGMGIFSNLGYIRGTISDGATDNIFTGNFYIAGYEAKMGTFTLTNDNAGGFTGSFTESPGITYSLTSAQTSPDTPSDLECARPDDDLLTQDTGYDHSGKWYDDAGTDMSVQDYTSTYVTSYLYYYSDGTPAYGTSVGIRASNQVSLANWHESGSDEGLEILIAKNSTAFYSIFWFFARVSEFDYNQKNEDDFFGQNLYVMYGSDSSAADDLYCYQLHTEEAEESCMGVESADDGEDESEGSSSGNEDDDDDVTVSKDVLYTVLAFSLLNFIAVIAFGVVHLTRRPPAPMASSTSNNL